MTQKPDLSDIDLTGKVVVGEKYTIGGFSDISRGMLEMNDVEDEVAIKSLRIKGMANTEEARERLWKRFYREVSVWRQLIHLNVVPLLGYIVVDGSPSLISPWYINGNVNNYLENHVDADRWSLISDVVDGLEYLHSIPVAHGDLKGENVLVDGHGHASLCDFGMAQFVDEASRITGFTTTNAYIGGTDRFMSPEVCENSQKTKATDMWALGCLIVQILTDEIPYKHLNARMAVLLAIVGGKPPTDKHNPKIDVDLWQWIQKCWSVMPDDRPKASELRSLLLTMDFHSPSTANLTQARKSVPTVGYAVPPAGSSSSREGTGPISGEPSPSGALRQSQSKKRTPTPPEDPYPSFIIPGSSEYLGEDEHERGNRAKHYVDVASFKFVDSDDGLVSGDNGFDASFQLPTSQSEDLRKSWASIADVGAGATENEILDSIPDSSLNLDNSSTRAVYSLPMSTGSDLSPLVHSPLITPPPIDPVTSQAIPTYLFAVFRAIDLPYTKVRVRGFDIVTNDRRDEVLSLIFIVDPCGVGLNPGRKSGSEKESWQIEKLYPEVLALDSNIRRKIGRSASKGLPSLPDAKLFIDQAPAKVDQRKVALENYIQLLINENEIKDDICVFLSTSLKREDRSNGGDHPGYKGGYLTKKGKRFGRWKTRYFVLQSATLRYYDRRGGQYLGSIFIDGAQIGRQQQLLNKSDDENSYLHAFMIIETEKSAGAAASRHVLCAGSDEERDSWVELLVREINTHRDKQESNAVGRKYWGFNRNNPATPKAPSGTVRQTVFGVPLESSLAVAQIAGLPAIVFRCIQYLEAKKADQEEWIYRLNGTPAVIKNLKDRFNAEGDVHLLESDEFWDPHAIAGLLKAFLRELPHSILTRELHLRFLGGIDLESPDERIDELAGLLSQLPSPNYSLLRALSAHLILIVQNASVNKMTMRNIRIVFSPTLNIPVGLFSLMLGEFEKVFMSHVERDL
ncbi:hypothetical protein FRC02_012402 [Tulasnella sp. 418]|nr:hypothetical protein FRC02_012402 [Tulasnella sp. 418]